MDSDLVLGIVLDYQQEEAEDAVITHASRSSHRSLREHSGPKPRAPVALPQERFSGLASSSVCVTVRLQWPGAAAATRKEPLRSECGRLPIDLCHSPHASTTTYDVSRERRPHETFGGHTSETGSLFLSPAIGDECN